MIPRLPGPVRRLFKRRYAFLLVAAGVLLVTSLFWAVLSVRLQNYNADHLIDSYLFESGKIFGQATFPSAHSFLLKWPLFAIAALFGNTTLIISILTVLCALAPVAALVWLLASIEQRPSVLALWLLALSSVLLLVPAQPVPGTLLPTNFAMFTTRNLEYALYLGVVALLVRSRHWRDRSAWLAAGAAVILIASDGLFMPLLIGPLLIMALLRRGRSRRIHGWLVVAFVGYVGSLVLLFVLQSMQVTNFSAGSSVTPYAIGSGIKQYVEAGIYAVLGVLTQLGANPAYSTLTLSDIPAAIVSKLRQPNALGFILNAATVVALAALSIRFIRRHWRQKLALKPADSTAELLLWSALVATVIFVLTNHYYPVDSRYLTIWLFALFAAGAVGLSSLKMSSTTINRLGVVLLLAIPLSILGSYHNYDLGRQGLSDTAAFQAVVAKQVAKQGVNVLVGDYWDVTPIRQQAKNRPTIIPLSTCTTAQVALASSAWQQVTTGTTIGYLVNDQPQQTGFKRCDPAAVKSIFGEPTQQIPVRAPGHPDAVLYVYAAGLQTLPKASPVAAPVIAKVAPPKPICAEGKVLNVVAHQDDDLLFMNPDLQRAITARKCIMSVYLTSGDAGSGTGYSVSRQIGAETAYARMYGLASVWNSGQVHYNGKRITQATLQSAPHLKLLFLNLPDGNVHGEGFAAHNDDSLAKLRTAAIASIASIDGTASYTDAELTAVLQTIMQQYHPTEVRTQNYSDNILDGDHSDHHAAGHYAAVAFENYMGNATLKSYIGYPGAELSENVVGADLAAKQAAFFAYGGFDGAVCNSIASCNDGSVVYGSYLVRQYSRLVAQKVIGTTVVTRPAPPPEPVAVKQNMPDRACPYERKQFITHCLFNPR